VRLAAVEPDVMTERDRRDYEAALDAFLAGRWQDASGLLRRLPRDAAAKLLNEFMVRHRQQPPPEWDGIIAMEAK
jgi:adenylate cyclase